MRIKGSRYPQGLYRFSGRVLKYLNPQWSLFWNAGFLCHTERVFLRYRFSETFLGAVSRSRLLEITVSRNLQVSCNAGLEKRFVDYFCGGVLRTGKTFGGFHIANIIAEERLLSGMPDFFVTRREFF